MSDHAKIINEVGYLRDLSEEMLYNHYKQFLLNQTFEPFKDFS